MAHRTLALWFVCHLIGCGTSATPNPNAPASDATEAGSSTSRSKPGGKDSEMSQWHDVPQNEPANQRSVIGNRKSEVIVVSNSKKHGDALHFQFTVNSVAISGIFSAPGGQTSTFTLPTGSVQFTVEECKGDAQYFELAAGEKVTVNCELTTDGDCCDVAVGDEQPKH